MHKSVLNIRSIIISISRNWGGGRHLGAIEILYFGIFIRIELFQFRRLKHNKNQFVLLIYDFLVLFVLGSVKPLKEIFSFKWQATEKMSNRK